MPIRTSSVSSILKCRSRKSVGRYPVSKYVGQMKIRSIAVLVFIVGFKGPSSTPRQIWIELNSPQKVVLLFVLLSERLCVKKGGRYNLSPASAAVLISFNARESGGIGTRMKNIPQHIFPHVGTANEKAAEEQQQTEELYRFFYTLPTQLLSSFFIHIYFYFYRI